MTRTAVVTQPTYLSWLGYFQAIAEADVVVFLDTVQFERRSWQSRNRLKGSTGEPYWLSVPVAKHHRDDRISDIRIANETDWAVRHLRSIDSSLRAAPAGADLLSWLAPHYDSPPELLADFTIGLIQATLATLDIRVESHRASELPVAGHRTELLLDICSAVGATRYLSAAGSAAYLEEERSIFDAAGVAIRYQSWEHPVYPQLGPGFVTHLAALDAIANIGPSATRDLITKAASSPAP